MRLVQSCLNAGKVWQKRFQLSWRPYEGRASLFKCPERSRKQFSPLWRSCEDRASLFMSQKRPRKQFSPLWRPCEDSASLFMCKEVLESGFHHCTAPVKLV